MKNEWTDVLFTFKLVVPLPFWSTVFRYTNMYHLHLSNRFWVVSGDWNYTYNPCRPFSQGTKQTSDCFGDVAVSCLTCYSNRKLCFENIAQVSWFHLSFDRVDELFVMVDKSIEHGPFYSLKKG